MSEPTFLISKIYEILLVLRFTEVLYNIIVNSDCSSQACLSYSLIIPMYCQWITVFFPLLFLDSKVWLL